MTGLDSACSVEYLAEDNTLYWSDYGTNAIHRLDLGGGEVETFVDGLALLPGEDAMIVADAELGVLYRLDLVTSELSLWLPEAGTHPSFLAVDTAGRMLYWGDNRDNVLRRRSLDGGAMETIAEGFAGPRGIVLVR